MKPLKLAPPEAFAAVRFVLTDMDETLTFQGRLAAKTYDALERLQAKAITVIPVTAAPAGWCDQMARMWPVDGVIGENGGLFIQRAGHDSIRTFWSDEPDLERQRLAKIAAAILAEQPAASLASDQPFRLSTIAFQATGRPDIDNAVEQSLRDHGLETTRNNLWVLGWLGGFDKLKMAHHVLATSFALDIELNPDAVIYVGDSTNDAPMFSFFPNAVGVSTVKECLATIPKSPAWITDGPGGSGFVEVADALLKSIS